MKIFFAFVEPDIFVVCVFL
jgi:hypothetical protein